MKSKKCVLIVRAFKAGVIGYGKALALLVKTNSALNFGSAARMLQAS